MSEIVLVLLAWIGENTDYNTSALQPNVVMVEPYLLCRRYGVPDRRRCEALKLQGFYDKDFTIYLRSDFDPDNVEDRAKLVHELVHWVQWRNDRNEVSDCMGDLEVEAYELQDHWRGQYGLSPKSDAFTLMMLSAACEA